MLKITVIKVKKVTFDQIINSKILNYCFSGKYRVNRKRIVKTNNNWQLMPSERGTFYFENKYSFPIPKP